MTEMTSQQIAQMIAKIRRNIDNEDALALVLADAFEAGQKAAIDSIKIDLADWHQTAAVQIIQSNY